MRTGTEVSKYVTGRGGVEHFSLRRRGEESLVFVEVGGEIPEVKETPVFQQALVAFFERARSPDRGSETNGLAGIGQDAVSATVAVAFSEEPTTARGFW